MSQLKVCRICLRTEAKMYHFDRYQLKFYYEEVMALKVNIDDGLPEYFCYECAMVLQKFHKFKEKCYSGQKILKELLWKGSITYESIYKVDRDENMLRSPLKVISLSDRVQTYITRDSSEFIGNDGSKKIIDEIEHTKTEYNSDISIEDSEILDINNENFYDNKHDNKIEQVEVISVDEKNIVKHKGKIAQTDKNIMVDKVTLTLNEENIKEGSIEKKIEVDKEDLSVSPISPKTVYIDTENGVIDINHEEIKIKKKKNKYRNLKANSLDDKNWKKSNLSEEKALEIFRAKAQDKKYLNAAFKCTDCFKWFSKKDILDRHILLRHVETLGPFECRFCHMRFRLDCFLKRHMKQHYAKYECLRCPLVCQLEYSAILHEEYHSGITRKCNFCNEEFRHMSTYYTHLRTHRSQHVCTLCGASFVSAMGLRQHKNIKHIIMDIESPDDDEEVNSYCDRCDIRFDTRKAYEEHLFHSAMHFTNEGDEQKDERTKKVLGKKEQAKITKGIRKRNVVEEKKKRNTGLKRCRRSKSKPTTCYQCGKHFTTQVECWKHHTSEHPRTSFFPPGDRYICEICGSSLAPGSVATHQNMHTREKLHTCDTCGRQFHTVVSLRRHLLTHTGEKPYACTLCDKRFTQSNSMKLHYRTFHLKQPYPKRNRRKPPEKVKETAEIADSSIESDSDESLPDAEPQPSVPDLGIEPVTESIQEKPPNENMHYLTLT